MAIEIGSFEDVLVKDPETADMPSLDHFSYTDYDAFYEPSDDSYLLLDGLLAALPTIPQCPLCVEIGYVHMCVCW